MVFDFNRGGLVAMYTCLPSVCQGPGGERRAGFQVDRAGCNGIFTVRLSREGGVRQLHRVELTALYHGRSARGKEHLAEVQG